MHPLQLLDKPILAYGVRIVDVACAMGDLIVSKSAITHSGSMLYFSSDEPLAKPQADGAKP